MKSVTIIIPVYKDWTTLQHCLHSLIKFVESRHKIIFVNDMSSEWSELEKQICEGIQGHENFYYYRNSENMGFVKTCNRAILELDGTDNDIMLLNSDTEVTEGFLEEMLQVLYLYEKHGIVCPRSNCATILTIPVKNNLQKSLDEEISYSVFQQIKNKLPRFSILPTGVGFAFLIKRELIEKFGVLDEIYDLGYNEENDFCMRVNQYGYSVVAANRAYVFHFESKSFGDTRNALELKNRNILLERYPYYDATVERYFTHSIHPLEYYADLIADGIYEKKRLLFSLYEIPSSYNGTAQYGLTIYKKFYELYNEKYDIHVLINEAADRLHGLSEKYPNVWYPHNITGTYHLAFSPSQIINMEHLLILNRVSLKYVFCMQDIISIRSNYLLINDYERLETFRKSIRYCAAMTSISTFSLNDTKGYYYSEFERRNIITKVIYHGINEEKIEMADDKLPFESYYMVFGNFYKHKFIEEIIPYLEQLDENFIILGSNDTVKISANIYGYQSGNLSDQFISELVYHSKAILFPSVYEGFGLPILDGIRYEKKVIAVNNELNRELRKAFNNFSENIYLYDNVEELRGLIKIIDEDPELVYTNGSRDLRTWVTVAWELEEFLANILKEELDQELLIERWEDMHYIENVHRMYAAGNSGIVKQNLYAKFKQYLRLMHPSLYRFARKSKRYIVGE